MTTAAELNSPSLQSRVARKAAWLCDRGTAVPLREWRRRSLRVAYLRGSTTPARNLPTEHTDPDIIETGSMLRQQVLTTHQGRHAESGYRVLVLRPRSLTSEIWFGDLAQCMNHGGIECQVLPHDTPTAAINATFEALRPNVFIATEAPETLKALDLPFVRRHKRDHACLRLFVPVWHANGPRLNVPSGRSTPEQDRWRRDLRRRGLTADAYFSIFEPEFHAQFSHDPDGPAIDYVTIPMACNPFANFPTAAVKCHDYFMASSLTDERVEVSHRLLRPILGRYRGLWAGQRWGFGTEFIPPSEMGLQYSQTRIALSPLVGFVHVYAAELTHRVYAAAACGAFQLTMPTAITARYFRPEELVQARSPAEFVRLFDHYVDRPLERNSVAMAALRRVFGEHTCFHRVDKLVAHWDDWRKRGLF